MLEKAGADSSAAMAMAVDTAMMSANDPPDPAEPPARRRQRLAAQGFGNVPELTGLAQVVGLALGSPEFQRR